MDTTTRSTLFGLLVVAWRPLTASEIVALAAPLGVTATNTKSHLTRMVADGALMRRGRVRSATYEPSRRQRLVIDGINARLGRDSSAPWNGRWVLVAPGPVEDGGSRADRVASLWFDGFRPLAGAVHLRPDWPGAWARRRAADHGGKSGVVFVAKQEPTNAERLISLYDLDGLDAEAHSLADELDARSSEKEPARAFAARMEVGGDVARLFGHDPRLPSELWGKRRGLGRLKDAYQRFEAATQRDAEWFLKSVLGDRDDRRSARRYANAKV